MVSRFRQGPAQGRDRTPFVGAAVAGFFLMVGIGLGGNFSTYLDVPSLFIVLGGTLGATLVATPYGRFRRACSDAKRAFTGSRPDLYARANRLLQLNAKARAEGILALQSELLRERDPYMRKALELLTDELPQDEIKRVLTFELQRQEDEAEHSASVFSMMAALSPAMGLVGTLIGLVEMLQHLNDPARIGPAMSVALITTLYGALLANLVFIPVAQKLRTCALDESGRMEMTLEGTLCIARLANPRITEECLIGFLPRTHSIAASGV